MTALALAVQQGLVDPTQVGTAVGRFTDFLLRYLLALAAVGALSMAFVELLKKLFDARTRFQARRFVNWVIDTRRDREALAASLPWWPGEEKAMAELLQLTTGVSEATASAAAERLISGEGSLPGVLGVGRQREHALFALELDRMMGSIQDAADVALGSPQRYPALYVLMASGAGVQDLAAWHVEASAIGQAPQDDAALLAAERVAARRRADLYARLKQVVKRKLDAFQLYTGDAWASWNQLAANVAGMATLFLVLVWVENESDHTRTVSLWTLAMLSLLGGVLAPLAKDIITALKRVKDG